VNDPDVKVRRLVASEHGVHWRAANLLTGETVEELETSAAALKRLIDARREQEHAPTTDIFTAARIATSERKHRLGLLFSGREQPRDAAGRYTSPATDFSGGARQPPPRRPQTHEQWLSDALGDRRADVGADL
jgi:hypothetical protein